MDKKPRPPLKPLKILVNLFSKSKSKSQEMVTGGSHTAPVARSHQYESQLSPPLTIRTCYAADDFLHPPSMPMLLSSSDSISMSARSTNHPDLYTEFEALHLSRQDNPFIQRQLVLSLSQDDLDALSCGGGGAVFDHSQSQNSQQFSPPYSPTRSCDPLVLEEVHAHLVRSPPPCYWPEKSFPLSPRSNGTFSPDSSEGGMMLGNDLDCSGGTNYYKRSQSEEHILMSPCSRSGGGGGGDFLKVGGGGGTGGAFSPVRGITPELLMTTSLHAGESFSFSSDRRRPKIRRNHTLGCDNETTSPLRNQAGCDCGATSISSYTMNHHCPASGGRRNLCARIQQQQPKQNLSAHKKTSGGGDSSSSSFFSSWRPRRRRQSTSDGGQQQQQERRRKQDAKSMENLQDDDRCHSSSLRLPDGCSPSARKSVCSVGTAGLGGCPPRNCATLFTRFKIKDTPMFIA